MTRGKKAAQAANRRANDSMEALASARAEVRALNARVSAMEVAHRNEVQRLIGEHSAEIDTLVKERYAATIEKAASGAADAKRAAIRDDARREFFASVKRMFDEGLLGVVAGKEDGALRALSSAAGFDVTGMMGQGESRYIRRMRQHKPQQMASIIEQVRGSRRPDGAPA